MPDQKSVVLGEAEITEAFENLPDRLKNLDESDVDNSLRSDLRLLSGKCHDYSKLAKQLVQFLQSNTLESEERTVTVTRLNQMIQQLTNLETIFQDYEEFQPLLRRYWDKMPKDLPETVPQEMQDKVDQLKADLKEKQAELKKFKDQHRKKSSNGKAKRLDKKLRDETKALEEKVKVLQRELNSAVQPVLLIRQREQKRVREFERQEMQHGTLLRQLAERRQITFQSAMSLTEYIEMVSGSYKLFRSMVSELQQKIRKSQREVMRNYEDMLAVVSVKQNDIDTLKKGCCNICFDDVPAKTEVAECSNCHQFCHISCVLKWFVKTESCPLCRHKT